MIRKTIRLAFFALAVFLGYVIGRMWSDLPVFAQSAAHERADLNGDGTADASDAIYLLNWLFLGGSAPVAFAEPPDHSAELAALAARVAALEEKEPPLTADGAEWVESIRGYIRLTDKESGDGLRKTIRFSRVNVQIVSGAQRNDGDPDTPNGLGNLIVGYNQPLVVIDGETGDVYEEIRRTGSHNLILGDFNNYTSIGGIVAGTENFTRAPYSSILSGHFNEILDPHCLILGGKGNTIAGNAEGRSQHSVIAGGSDNHVFGSRFSLILGGPSSSIRGEEYSLGAFGLIQNF